MLIEDNYLSGGGYTVYTLADDFSFNNSVVRNNRIEAESWRFGWRRDTANSTDVGNKILPS